MEAMGLVAILVNCALIGLSGQVQRMFPEMSATQTILLIVALEHIMLIIRFFIICAIPDIPSWVATEMAKVEFLRREAVRRLSSTPSPSDQHASTVIGMLLLILPQCLHSMLLKFCGNREVIPMRIAHFSIHPMQKRPAQNRDPILIR